MLHFPEGEALWALVENVSGYSSDSEEAVRISCRLAGILAGSANKNKTGFGMWQICMKGLICMKITSFTTGPI